MLNAKDWVVRTLRRMGVVATSLRSSPDGRIGRLLESYRIDTVLDIGANIGQYGTMLRRELGFSGSVFSFEPMPTEFEKLKQLASTDANWRVYNFGFGDKAESMKINIAANSASSSFLPRSAILSRVAPETEFVGVQVVEVRRLDDVYPELGVADKNVYLKIDAQGFEGKILAGAESALGKVAAVQMEMQLVPTYEGALPFRELLEWMATRGFRLVHLIPGIFDKQSGELLECDGVFHRATELSSN